MSVVADAAVDVCCRGPSLRSSGALLRTAVARDNSASAADTSLQTRLAPASWCPLLVQALMWQVPTTLSSLEAKRFSLFSN